jgi:proteasome lid subunit RPN8/RPN11
MSNIDVSDLEREELPAGKFAVDPRVPFRLQIAPEVHRGVQAHAKADPSVEICGILVGRWGRDEFGPFAQVTDYIRCDSASSKLAEVTFTHESWAQINHEMDTKYADKRIVGWYHTHPDFGIFLSDRDGFIHEHFFSGPGQVAYVVDPVRDLEGVFSWQKGKPTPMSHYWVGNEIRSGQTNQRQASRHEGKDAAHIDVPATAAQAAAGAINSERAPWSSTTTLLAGMALFLLGYLLANSRSQWEQRNLIEGAVTQFYSKGMRLGLEPELAKVQQSLRTIETELSKLPEATEKLSPEEAEKADKNRRAVRDNLLVAVQSLEKIRTTHALTPEELSTYAQLVALKYAELERLLSAQRPRRPTPADIGSKPIAPDDASRSKANAAAPEPTKEGAGASQERIPGSAVTETDPEDNESK